MGRKALEHVELILTCVTEDLEHKERKHQTCMKVIRAVLVAPLQTVLGQTPLLTPLVFFSLGPLSEKCVCQTAQHCKLVPSGDMVLAG